MTHYRAVEAAEKGAAIMVAAGMPRMPARVMMALIAAPADGYTAADLRERLGVSAAAVSGAVRYLQQLHFIQRRSLPGRRRERYLLAPRAFYRSVVNNAPVYDQSANALERMAADLGDDEAAGRRATQIAGFFRFLSRRMPQLIDEWESLQADDATALRPGE
ncbi:MAG TPA: helix-turn-helix domain-containing protein [Microbacteriaceae bacterium]|nr:helix-turn-helix domain-containing protein [Microbacteriaceae bacterium]